jgi:hypothetical protein
VRVKTISVCLALGTMSVCAHAQWVNYRSPGTPRTKDGKVNLAAPAPRINGKPDLSGIWQAEGAPRDILLQYIPGDGINGVGESTPSQYFFNVLVGFKPEESPLRPEAAKRWRELGEAAAKQGPQSLCLPTSPVPIADVTPAPFKIVQTSQLMLFLYEADTAFRQIYLDGRKQLEDPQPSWLGYSVGRWEGDTLVVDVVGIAEKTPLDLLGHPHSESMRLTQRFHRRDFGHMDVQMTIDDPKTYTRPVTFKYTDNLLPDTDLIESFCTENEKDSKHMAAIKP